MKKLENGANLLKLVDYSIHDLVDHGFEYMGEGTFKTVFVNKKLGIVIKRGLSNEAKEEKYKFIKSIDPKSIIETLFVHRPGNITFHIQPVVRMLMDRKFGWRKIYDESIIDKSVDVSRDNVRKYRNRLVLIDW